MLVKEAFNLANLAQPDSCIEKLMIIQNLSQLACIYRKISMFYKTGLPFSAVYMSGLAWPALSCLLKLNMKACLAYLGSLIVSQHSLFAQKCQKRKTYLDAMKITWHSMGKHISQVFQETWKNCCSASLTYPWDNQSTLRHLRFPLSVKWSFLTTCLESDCVLSEFGTLHIH